MFSWPAPLPFNPHSTHSLMRSAMVRSATSHNGDEISHQITPQPHPEPESPDSPVAFEGGRLTTILNNNNNDQLLQPPLTATNADPNSAYNYNYNRVTKQAFVIHWFIIRLLCLLLQFTINQSPHSHLRCLRSTRYPHTPLLHPDGEDLSTGRG